MLAALNLAATDVYCGCTADLLLGCADQQWRTERAGQSSVIASSVPDIDMDKMSSVSMSNTV
ncbi:hypothetical protein, partial [Xanthomonas oryzae]|uniref:hypothetical protein n=1 Tax=Xanthomonas oryzae TaxID=347 RepID=UPI001C0C6014